MMLAHDRSLGLGVIAPQAVLGISFAVLIAPLTASVMSSVAQSDEGLASGINNAASRVAQLAGVAVAAGLGTLIPVGPPANYAHSGLYMSRPSPRTSTSLF
jgi:hypothetical protein